MHHTRLSIFILPVLIIGLSIFTTFVEENPSFAKLFSISQVANPTAGEEGVDVVEEVVDSALDDAEEILQEEAPVETQEEADVSAEQDAGGGSENQEIQEETQEEPAPSDDSGESASEETPQEEVPSEDTGESEQEEVVVETVDTPAEEVVEEEVPPVDAELLAQKIAQFEVSKSMISGRFQQNLARLETARDELYAKISLMEQEGKDASRAKDALSNLEDAIAQSKQYIRSTETPDSIPGIQRILGEYIKNIRDSIQVGYTALFKTLEETQ